MADDALRQALRLQQDAEVQGFDWNAVDALWPKLQEEIEELRSARNQAEQQEELGDLLFMVVNIARHLGVDASHAMALANAKFGRRFAHVMAAPDLPPLGDSRRMQCMEARWRHAKALERGGQG